MFNFTDQLFLDGYAKRFGRLNAPLADNILRVLHFIEADSRFAANPVDRYKIAYMLATFKWETAHTFAPIDEFGGDAYFEKRYGYQTSTGKRLGNTAPGDGALYHGRGYVQLTGKANYQRASQAFGVDLLKAPDLAKEPGLAYQIAASGMIAGAFTGRKFSQYFKAGAAPDYDAARAIINGTDRAAEIADLARRFDELLVISLA